ncbi:MAG: hypothetical protein JKY04_04135, partial [Sneathiella sp.]|nr:hypothetical protein [Sneathiella sp.]
MVGTQNDYGIKYGWCHTDHKDGKEIRTDYRDTDYMKDEPYASSVNKMLKKMGLPIPDKDQVFRGTHHDLLFLDDHGVVIRIGPTDVDDLVHPAIIQPLGWMNDDENKISVAIYPGFELATTFKDQSYATDARASLKEALDDSGQGSADVSNNNTGMAYIMKDGKETPIAILIDPDNKFNGTKTSSDEGSSLQRIRDQAASSANTLRKSSVMEDAIHSISKLGHDMKDWEQVFMMHQPLRTRFWLAHKDSEKNGVSDPLFVKQFWDECKSLRETPKSYTFSKYTQYKNENGIKVGRVSNHAIENVSLYAPWTGKEEDQKRKNVIPPHKQKILDAVRENPEKAANVHDLFLRNESFVMLILDANPKSIEFLPGELKTKPELMTYAYRIDTSVL